MNRVCPQCEVLTDAGICAVDGFQTVLVSSTSAGDVDERLGEVFQGRYLVRSLLGRGGMGSVYRATQLSVQRPVALKVMNAAIRGNLKYMARFQQEARAIAALEHPGAIKLLDSGQTDAGEMYLVMEFLEGSPLDEVIVNEAPLAPARVIDIGSQILEVLNEAHQKGIVHRDLKPENIFIKNVTGKHDFVKVLDFGIAKLIGEAEGDRLTATGAAVGSAKYMSPEQAKAMEVTGATDLYSLGCVLYELLTGRPPFDDGSSIELMVSHASLSPPWPSLDGRALEGPLVDVIMSCLAKDPEARPGSAASMLTELRRAGPVAGAHRSPAGGLKRRENTTAPRAKVPSGVATGVARDRVSDVHSAASRRGGWLLVAAACMVVGGGAVAVVSALSGSKTDATVGEVVAVASQAVAEADAGTTSIDVQVAVTTAGVSNDASGSVAPTDDVTNESDSIGSTTSAETMRTDTSAPVVTIPKARKQHVVEVRSDHSLISVAAGAAQAERVAVSWDEGAAPPTVRVTRSGFVTQDVTLSDHDASIGERVVRLVKERQRYEVVVDARRARISRAGDYLGTGRATVSWMEGTPPPKVVAERKGYHSQRVTLRPKDAIKGKRVITLKKKVLELPTVESAPPNPKGKPTQTHLRMVESPSPAKAKASDKDK